MNHAAEKQLNAGKESFAMNFMQKNRLFHVLRYVLLFGFLAFLTFELSMHVLGDKTYPNVHALCPFGGLESLLSFLAMDGTFLKKIFSGTMGIFFVFLILTLIFNRAFCGLLCPFGALQELFGNTGKRFLKVRPVMDTNVDRIARYFKYVVLFLAVVMAWWTGTLWYQTFDPWTAYAHLANPTEALTSYGIGIAFLLISIAGSFFYERFFCKYLCPLGALNAVIGKISGFFVKRDAELCINCSLCTGACPSNIDVEHEITVNSAECIGCGKCVTACPQEGALDFSIHKRKINPLLVLILVIAIYFGGISVFQTFGFDRYTGAAEQTLREIAKSQGMTVQAFREQYALPAELSNRAVASEVEEAIPLFKMAELNGMDATALKKELGLPAGLDDNTPWGEAFGQVTLEKMAELNGIALPELMLYYGLPADQVPTTQWKDVKEQVEQFLSKQTAAQGCDTGSCEGE